MENHHTHLITLLGNFWERYSVDLNPFETLCIIDFAYDLICKQQKYGVKEDRLLNGFMFLCNAYSRKIHSQITPLIIGVLKNEATHEYEEKNGIMKTLAPEGLI
jgi:hypothetical protein